MARWTGLLPVTQVKGRSAYGPSPPSLFVGRVGYPTLNAGPLVTPVEVADPGRMDRPPDWTGMELGDVLALRSGLLRANARIKVTDARKLIDPTRAMQVSQELAMAERPAHTELTFSRDVDLTLSPLLAGFAAPTGPRVTVKRAELTENTVVPRKVDQVVGDLDARAAVGAKELYASGISSYQVQKLLSAGLLGHARDRLFVPTRWAVTATDDMLGKALLPQVKDQQELGEVRLHFHTLHGNRFHVLLLPGAWSFEMLEAWLTPKELPDGTYRRELTVLADHEGHEGRTTYAAGITGAYYAARLSVLEHLRRIQRQARVLVLREITDDYYAPAGVWVIREGVRLAMARGPRALPGLEEALAEVTRENVLGSPWAAHSRFIDEARHQTTLDAFL